MPYAKQNLTCDTFGYVLAARSYALHHLEGQSSQLCPNKHVDLPCNNTTQDAVRPLNHWPFQVGQQCSNIVWAMASQLKPRQHDQHHHIDYLRRCFLLMASDGIHHFRSFSDIPHDVHRVWNFLQRFPKPLDAARGAPVSEPAPTKE